MKIMQAIVVAALVAACGGSGSEFDGDLLVYPDDFPVTTTKDLDSGDLGGVADWYEISGVVTGEEYTVVLDLQGNEGDDLSFTAVKDAHGTGPDNDYCHGLAQAQESGPACSFTAVDAVFYVYVMRGFVEDGATEIDYALSLVGPSQ